MRVRAIILGCASSGGVPRIGGADGRGEWGECDPGEPRNRRTRSSIVIQRADEERGWSGELTTVLIDTAPELREQLTSVGVGRVDAVCYTHDHADQCHGIDDLRALALMGRARVPVYWDEETAPGLMARFGYCFESPEGSPYPPILDGRALPPAGETLTIEGPSGPLPVTPFRVEHGHVPALGFRAGPIAYSPDLNEVEPEGWAVIEGAQVWIVDALRRKPHPSHAHLSKALSWIERAGVPRGVLTNLHIDMDYRAVAEETPENVEPAYDGMIVEAEGHGR